MLTGAETLENFQLSAPACGIGYDTSRGGILGVFAPVTVIPAAVILPKIKLEMMMKRTLIMPCVFGNDVISMRKLSSVGLLAIIASVSSFSVRAIGNDLSQTQLSENAIRAVQEEDRALNTAYAKLEPNLELKTAERVWIAFRDAQCKYEAAVYAGGSLQEMTYSRCIVRLTKSRTGDLLELASYQEYRRR